MYMSSPSEIADFIRNHDNFLIVTHVFPDGDNMGSMLALVEALGILGKKCASYVEGPVPLIYTWMDGADKIYSDIDAAHASLNCSGNCPVLFAVDSSDLQRIGESFAKWFSSQKDMTIANVDHHVTNNNFGSINWVDPGYSSVGEMIYEILTALDIKLTPTMAQNLFVSVYTDTGRFSFSNTTHRSLSYAADYVAAGALPIIAFRNVYANRSLASFHLQTVSFQTLERFLDGRGCYFWVDQAMLRDTGTQLEDTEGFIDAVRTLRDFEIVAFVKEVGPSDIRISIRAHPPINASSLMALFGGGGHPRAAGCRIDMPLQDAIRHFVTVAERAIKSGEVLEA
jgi:bifunctional oligoribonuclease and PAP phosphatase NrnA